MFKGSANSMLGKKREERENDSVIILNNSGT